MRPVGKCPLSCLSLTELFALSSQTGFKLLPVLLLFERQNLGYEHYTQKVYLLLFEIFFVLEELLLKVT